MQVICTASQTLALVFVRFPAWFVELLIHFRLLLCSFVFMIVKRVVMLGCVSDDPYADSYLITDPDLDFDEE